MTLQELLQLLRVNAFNIDEDEPAIEVRARNRKVVCHIHAAESMHADYIQIGCDGGTSNTLIEHLEMREEPEAYSGYIVVSLHDKRDSNGWPVIVLHNRN